MKATDMDGLHSSARVALCVRIEVAAHYRKYSMESSKFPNSWIVNYKNISECDQLSL